MATHMRTSLIVEALQMAIDGGHVRADAIFHSDRLNPPSTPRPSSPSSATRIRSAPASGEPVSAGTTRLRRASSPR
jgi:hypothetical protein